MQLAGYTYLIETLELALPPLGLELAVGSTSKDEIVPYGKVRMKLLGKNKKVGNSIYEQIETAIKYQGIRLAYLTPIFSKLDQQGLTAFIQEKPTSNIRRCIWYLYEFLTDEELDIPDSSAAYTPLLDEKYYYTSKTGKKDPRTRVIDNMLGGRNFCPMVRKTAEVRACESKDLMGMAQAELLNLQTKIDPEQLGRSLEYLYTKETKSSTEIEKEVTPTAKMRKFYRVLKTSGTVGLNKRRLVEIQNEIVRSEVKDQDYRVEEIYVGETRPTWKGFEENIHYIGPTHAQVPELMEGLLSLHKSLLIDSSLPPMMHAAVISFGFVYVHPFRDGNGRIHRYLIHDVLKSRTSTEQDFIIPVSATILQRTKEYDRVLEVVSRPVMALIDYDIDEKDHSVTVNNDISFLYKYPDLTDHVCFLYEMMEASISVDLLQEVEYIVLYDAVKKIIDDSYDIPNNKLNLLIQLAIQGKGTISGKKRKFFTEWIPEEHLGVLEETIRSALEKVGPQASMD
jgi:hypothetical protein